MADEKILPVLIEGYDANKVKEMEQNQHVDEHWKLIHSARQNNMILQSRLMGIETKLNKPVGIVQIGHIRGLIPLEFSGVETINEFRRLVGQLISFKITNFDREGDAFTASRQAALEHMASSTWQKVEEGQQTVAVIRDVERKRLHVDVGGILSVLNVTEYDHGFIDDLRDHVKTGDHIKVLLTRVDKEEKVIEVSAKALKSSPWPDCTRRYHVQSEYVGKVTGTTEYGNFVNLEPGVDALTRHMKYQGVEKGDWVLIRITGIDVDKQQIRAKIVRKA